MKYQKYTIDLLGAKRSKGMLRALPKPALAVLSAIIVVGLTACGTDDTVENRTEQRTIELSGNPLDSTITPEVQRFQNSVYGVLYDNCNNCHKLGGQKSSAPFADRNPITAFEAALDLFDPVNQTNPRATNVPASSALVVRVAGSHNCWSVCADNAATIRTALETWLALETDPNREIEIPTETPPVAETLVDEAYVIPTPGIEFDPSEDVPQFRDNGLHALLKTYCSNCHVPNAAAPQQPQAPYFAQDDATLAYNELVDADKVNLNKPDDSQLYKRVAVQQHNCWSNCTANGNEILALITAWAGSRTVADSVDPNLLYSGALKLGEGQITSGGQRYDTYTIAKWEFKEGSDDDTSNDRVAQDSSGIAPFLDLNLNANVSWVSGYGIEFGAGGKAMSTDAEANKKLHGMILAAGEFSVEAWVVPANTSQQNEANNSISSAVIVSYSFGEQQRNFALGQNLYQYEMYNRINAASSANGDPVFATPGEVLSATLQHVVMTYSVTNGRRFYVNGNPIVCDTPPDLADPEYESACQAVGGGAEPITNLSQWNPNFFLTLGSETNNRNPWLGQIRFLAIHNKELTEANIDKNFDAGVGQKFNLLFNISDIAGINLDGSGNSVPRSYIWFEVSEFDGHSYLLNHPQFINLSFNGIDADGQPTTPPSIDFTLKGMRMGVNGKESEVGQAFANLGKTTRPNTADPMLRINNNGEPIPLATLQGQLDTVSYTPADGTIIPKQNGVKLDQFFLTFEEIGGVSDAMARGTAYGNLPFEYTSEGDTFVVGVRTFDEINATMAALTGVSAQTVNDEYQVLKGQLPATEAVQGFLSSNQVGIASLAALYCGELVDNSNRSIPTAYFGISPDQTRDTAFTGANAGNVDLVSQNLVDKMVRNIDTIETSGIQAELSGLADYLIANCGANFSSQNGGCNNQARTQAILKSMCTALLSSAVVTHQ